MSSLVWMAGILTLACMLVFAPDSYLPMLLRAFLVQWTLLFLLSACLLLWKGSRQPAIATLMGSFLLCAHFPYTRSSAFIGSDGTGLRVLHMNVWQPNRDHEEVVQQALASNAHLISVQEVDLNWARELTTGLQDRYPYSRIEARSDCYGIAMFSQLPIERFMTRSMDDTPFLEAHLRSDGRPIRFISIHATSPISYGHFQRRNRQLEGLAQHVAGCAIPTVVVGDLNTVPWDEAYERLCAEAGLHAPSAPVQRTWPSLGHIALIPLDHLLLSTGASARSIDTFTIPGSDHRGLLAEVILPPHAP
ncbi:MAG: endonuclease/exonuclease/phosphatase family protein [Flavobacteriales bacterium]|nr:endonuclease/exonuclease/phosphatase family protein [Flavobacteriales bacterium]